MKKTYSTPKVETILLCTPIVMQSQSKMQGGGDDSGSGIAESKEWQGGFLWEEKEEE